MTRLPLILALCCFSLPALAAPPLAVEIVTVEEKAETRAFSLTGEIVARDPVALSFPTGGRLAEVAVEAGDRVEAGAVLARLDAVQQQQALRAAQAALASAQADHSQAIEDFDRQQSLLERGATTRLARDNAEDAFTIAEGSLAQAEAQLDLARKSLDDTVLRAPKAATVIEKLGEPGEVVGAAQPVLRLALGDGLDALFDVPEAMLVDDSNRQPVHLTLLDYPDLDFTGQTREISPLVDLARGTVAVTVTMLDPPEVATFGDAVVGTVSWDSQPRIALPHTAITDTQDGPAVWVVDPGTMSVSLLPVEVARFETGRIILAAGLEPGMQVVARGAHLLFPGRVVRPVEGME